MGRGLLIWLGHFWVIALAYNFGQTGTFTGYHLFWLIIAAVAIWRGQKLKKT